MAIVCRKCNYILPQATIISYVASAAAGPMFIVTKDIILAYLQLKIAQTRQGYTDYLNSVIENMAIGIAKQAQISCPMCSHFEDWMTEPNVIEVTE